MKFYPPQLISSKYFLKFSYFLIVFYTTQFKSQKIITAYPGGLGVGVTIVINNDIKLTAGYDSALVGIKTINIIYNYSRMSVCEFNNEAEYLADKSEKYRERWHSMRRAYFEPRFEEKFNQYISKIGIYAANDSITYDATLSVEIIKLEPTYHHQLFKKSPPYIIISCLFIAKNEDLLVAYKLSAHGSKEMSDWDRLAECYAIAGKMLGGKLSKNLNYLRKN